MKLFDCTKDNTHLTQYWFFSRSTKSFRMLPNVCGTIINTYSTKKYWIDIDYCSYLISYLRIFLFFFFKFKNTYIVLIVFYYYYYYLSSSIIIIISIIIIVIIFIITINYYYDHHHLRSSVTIIFWLYYIKVCLESVAAM